MNIHSYYSNLKAAFEVEADAERALKQQAYMKENFSYIGLMTPVRTRIFKAFTKQYGWPEQGIELQDFVELCYGDEYRELHYAAIEVVQKRIKKCPPEYLATLEYLITTHPWWDTVDWVAKLVGMYFQQYPEAIKPTTERWMASNHLWLQRTSIIFQLFYKKNTDTALLFDYILRLRDSKEFFIQKAAGWALRQHSRTNPQLIRTFIEKHEADLAPLTKREGMRLILKNDW